MRSDSERRQSRRSAASRTQPAIFVDSTEVKLVNFSSRGLRIETAHLLSRNAVVTVAGEVELAAGPFHMSGPCRVRWCSDVGQALYHAGLSFENTSDVPPGAGTAAGSSANHYETLHVRRDADEATIHQACDELSLRCDSATRSYKQIYQSDCTEFMSRIEHARDVLCDPSRRERFNLQLAAHDRAHLYLFESWQNSRNEVSEARKRQVLLGLLDSRRIWWPDCPGIALRDFEDLMGCPSEYLEFNLWVLRQSKQAKLGDFGRYEITRRGTAALETWRAEQRSALGPSVHQN